MPFRDPPMSFFENWPPWFMETSAHGRPSRNGCEPCMVRKKPNSRLTFEHHCHRHSPDPGSLVGRALVCSDSDVLDLCDQHRGSLCRLHRTRTHPPRTEI